jgi:hypothetical protein
VGDRDGYDVGRLQRHHFTPPPIGHSPNGGAPKACRQQAVVPRWLPAALQVPEYERPSLLAGECLDVSGDHVGDATNAFGLARERLPND